MSDIQKFARKKSFIDFHFPGEKEELISELSNILDIKQTSHREGLKDIREENPPNLAEWLSTEQNTRILFIERLIQLIQELPIVSVDSVPEKPEPSGESSNPP